MSVESDRPAEERGVKQRRRRRRRLVVLVVLVLILALLGVDNSHDVELEYLVGDAEVRLVWVIVVAFLLGAVAERMYGFVRGRRDDD